MWKPILLVMFTILLIAFRLVGSSDSWWLQNVSPFVALFFCGAVYRKSCSWLLPVVFFVWIVTNPVSSMMQGYSPFHFGMLSSVFALGLIVWGGSKMAMAPSWLSVLLGTAASAVVFYVVTNSVCFVTSPEYTKTIDGYMQALWFGLPQYEVPTWAFFRNSFVSSLVFSTLFFWSMQPVRRQDYKEIGLASTKERG